jgi:GNAT superfamily N-acetyltransferase
MMTNAADAVRRLTLRPGDAWIGDEHVPWLAEAWCAIDGLRPAGDAPTTPAGLRDAVMQRWPAARIDVIDVEMRGIGGFVVWETAPDEPDATIIRGLATRRPWRNVGYGGEAVEQLEASRPGSRFIAAVPRWNGLALYFWLRVGFRPVRDGEDRQRARDPDHLWMLRARPAEVSVATRDP